MAPSSTRNRKDAKARVAATLGGLTAIILWSTTVGLVRSLSEQLGPLTAAAAVQILAGAAGLACLAVSPQARRNVFSMPRAYLFGCGALFVFYMLVFYLAVGLARDRNQALIVGLLNYLWPTLTIVFSLPLLKQRASRLLIPATLLALAGLCVVMLHGSGGDATWADAMTANPAAYVLALAAAVSWALYSVLARFWASDRPGGAVETFLFTAGVVLGGLLLVFPETPQWSARAATETGFLAAATYLGYALWDHAMRRGNVALVASCAYLIPLLSTLVSCAYLGVPVSIALLAGCAMVIAGSMFSWRSVSESA